MNYFWPHRATPKGFSIEGLAKKYREKIYKKSFDDHSESKFLDKDSNFKINKQKINNRITRQSSHWANRDFSEYLDVA